MSVLGILIAIFFILSVVIIFPLLAAAKRGDSDWKKVNNLAQECKHTK